MKEKGDGEDYRWAREYVKNARGHLDATELLAAAQFLLVACGAYEKGITWMTTCHGCADLTEKLYHLTVELEIAEAAHLKYLVSQLDPEGEEGA